MVPLQGIAGESLELDVFLEHLIGPNSSFLASLVFVSDTVILHHWGPFLGGRWTRLSERLVDVLVDLVVEEQKRLLLTRQIDPVEGSFIWLAFIKESDHSLLP